MTARIVAIVQACSECPNRRRKVGGKFECLLVGVELSHGSEMPTWCPLPKHPAERIAELEHQLQAMMR